MNVSILHISDLHRDPAHELRNGALIRSLEGDRDRYRAEDPSIPSPDIVVVSGDLVQGVPVNITDPHDALAEQYRQAEEFLVSLADHFCAGNRERVVLVPGNHDISMSHVYASLKHISPDKSSPYYSTTIAEYVTRLSHPDSMLRWSWQELAFLEIIDHDKYHARLEAFTTFYTRYYQGRRRYSLHPEEQYEVFDYSEFGITLVAFNSCCNNDPLNRKGHIHPEAIAAAARELHHVKYAGRLLFAVWHHNTSGGPADFDYLDSDVLQVLIDCGFSIGLHGHQHKSQFIDERFLFGSDRKITVISAGTLCGGKRVLPPGHARSYNILEINTDRFSGMLHQRRMLNDDLASPVWAPGWFTTSGRSFVTFGIQHPLVIENDLARLAEAERLVTAQQYGAAKSILRPLSRTNGLARRMLLECHTNQLDLQELITDLFPPVSSTEAIYLADALWESGDRSRLQTLLNGDLVSKSNDPSIVEIRNKFKQRLQN